MGLFNSKKVSTSIALITIDSSSVGGALAHIESDTVPTIYYTARKEIEVREHEEASEAMLRTLTELSDTLISQGGPALRQETGSGHIDRVLVGVGAPWQKSEIRIEAIVESREFIFTEALLSEITKKESEIPEEFMKSGETILATLLNGYETPKPFGQKVTRADVIILSSLIDAHIAQLIEKALRRAYHTHALTLTALTIASYEAFRDIFPHEKDFTVVEVSDNVSNVAFVKQGLLVDVVAVSHNQVGSKAIDRADANWLSAIEAVLQEASDRHALPRTLFLLAKPDARDDLKQLLDSSRARSAWKTGEQLRVIAVVPAHFAQFVKSRGKAEGDVFLSLLALYSRKTLKK